MKTKVSVCLLVLVACGGAPEDEPEAVRQSIDSTLESVYVISWPPIAPGTCASSTNNIPAALSDHLWCTYPDMHSALRTSCRMAWDGWINFDLCNSGVNVEPPAIRTFKAVRQGGPGSCYSDLDCPQSSGQICEAGQCVNGCRGDQTCRPDMRCDPTIPPYGECVLR